MILDIEALIRIWGAVQLSETCYENGFCFLQQGAVSHPKASAYKGRFSQDSSFHQYYLPSSPWWAWDAEVVG